MTQIRKKLKGKNWIRIFLPFICGCRCFSSRFADNFRSTKRKGQEKAQWNLKFIRTVTNHDLSVSTATLDLCSVIHHLFALIEYIQQRTLHTRIYFATSVFVWFDHQFIVSAFVYITLWYLPIIDRKCMT